MGLGKISLSIQELSSAKTDGPNLNSEIYVITAAHATGRSVFNTQKTQILSLPGRDKTVVTSDLNNRPLPF